MKIEKTIYVCECCGREDCDGRIFETDDPVATNYQFPDQKRIVRGCRHRLEVRNETVMAPGQRVVISQPGEELPTRCVIRWTVGHGHYYDWPAHEVTK